MWLSDINQTVFSPPSARSVNGRVKMMPDNINQWYVAQRTIAFGPENCPDLYPPRLNGMAQWYPSIEYAGSGGQRWWYYEISMADWSLNFRRRRLLIEPDCQEARTLKFRAPFHWPCVLLHGERAGQFVLVMLAVASWWPLGALPATDIYAVFGNDALSLCLFRPPAFQERFHFLIVYL